MSLVSPRRALTLSRHLTTSLDSSPFYLYLHHYNPYFKLLYSIMMDHAARLFLKDSMADIDFHSKIDHIRLRRERRRVTWTRFHLSRDQDWPRWTKVGNSESDDATFLGPLAGVEGCERVWLGRQIDDPEKAALIVRMYRSHITRIHPWFGALLSG